MNQFIHILSLGIIFSISLPTLALVLRDYTCPDVIPVQNINLTAFLDKFWYEFARYPNEIDGDRKCVIYVATQSTDGLKVKMANVPADSPDAVPIAVRLPPDNRGIFILDLPSGSQGSTTEIYENVLVIDYEQYYIGYGCKYDDKTGVWNEYSWVLTTSKNPDASVKTAINDFIKSSKFLNASKYEWLNLEDENCKPIY